MLQVYTQNVYLYIVLYYNNLRCSFIDLDIGEGNSNWHGSTGKFSAKKTKTQSVRISNQQNTIKVESVILRIKYITYVHIMPNQKRVH